MKLIYISLTLTFVLLSCIDKQIKSSDSKNIVQQNALKGIWTIKKYTFSQICAMDEKMANEWLNKSLIINDKLNFDYKKITSYKDVFENVNNCSVLNINKPDLINTDALFEINRDPLDELMINKSRIRVYKTTCADNPFSELVLNDKNEIIIRWDGVFFVLIKE